MLTWAREKKSPRTTEISISAAAQAFRLRTETHQRYLSFPPVRCTAYACSWNLDLFINKHTFWRGENFARSVFFSNDRLEFLTAELTTFFFVSSVFRVPDSRMMVTSFNLLGIIKNEYHTLSGRPVAYPKANPSECIFIRLCFSTYKWITMLQMAY